MREAFKAYIGIDSSRRLLLFRDQKMRAFQSFLLYPAFRRFSKYLFKIPLKGSHASTRKPGKLTERHMVNVVAVHESLEVDLEWFRKVKEKIFDATVLTQE